MSAPAAPAPEPGPLTDDRGAAVAPRALLTNDAADTRDDPQLADLRARAYVNVTNGRDWWYIPLIIIIGFVIASLASLILPALPRWIVVAPIVVSVVCIAALRARHAVNLRSSAYADLFLREGRCPGCAYVLDGVTDEPDGCRVCPECGGAWKRERIGSSTDQSAAQREYRRRVHQATGLARWIPPLRGTLTVIDAREHAASISNPRLRNLDDETAARIGPQRIDAIRKGTGWNQRGKGGLVAGGFMLSAIMNALSFRPTPLPASSARTILSIVMPIATLILGVWLMVLAVGVFIGDAALSAKQVARVFVAEGVCPQCLADLPETPATDGARVCRCGAAWKPDQSAATSARR